MVSNPTVICDPEENAFTCRTAAQSDTMLVYAMASRAKSIGSFAISRLSCDNYKGHSTHNIWHKST